MLLFLKNLIPIFSILFSAISSVLDTVSFKRVSEIASKYHMNRLSLSFFDSIMIIIVFILPFSFLSFMIESWKDFFSLISHPYLLLMLLGMVIADIIQVTLWSYAYANEKISILTPYEEISPILGIILGFFLFTWTDWRTLVAALVAIIVLWFSNLEKWKFHFNKNCLYLVVSQIFLTINILLGASLVEHFSPMSMTIGSVVVSFILLSIYFVPRRKLLSIPKKTSDIKTYLINDGVSNLSWFINVLIALFMYQEVGVTLTILLSMGVMIISFIASYVIYRDIPSRKNIATSFIVLLCIWIGTYYSPLLSLD